MGLLMNKKFLSAFLCLTLVITSSIPALGMDQKRASLAQEKSIENSNEYAQKPKEKDGQVFLSGKLSKRQVASKDSAIKYLQENKDLLPIENIDENLEVVETKKDELGGTFVTFQQTVKGIKLKDKFIKVYFSKDGVISSITGELDKNKEITYLGNKVVSEDEAITIAKSHYTYETLRQTPKAERLILSKNNKNYEVFKVNISYSKPTFGNWDVYVEVTSGEVIHSENHIRNANEVAGTGIDVQGFKRSLNLYYDNSLYQMRDYTRPSTAGILTYSSNGATDGGYIVSNSTNSFNSEYDKASVSAHYNTGQVIDFYKKLFNRNSIDNAGMRVDSFTHYGSNYNNAFWTGYEMVYGDGDGKKFTYLSGDLDIVGHEITHGVIDRASGLGYEMQSGALNESMADVFGVLISTYSKYNVASGGKWTFNPDDWVVGDDVYTPSIKGDALRSLSNPSQYNQPSHMKDYKDLPNTEESDWGGVHLNSGIPNKAAYLIAEAIGMEKTAKIYYRALENYIYGNTTFINAKKAFMQAAKDLYGIGGIEASAINKAFSSVGVGQVPENDVYEPNDSLLEAYPLEIGKGYDSYISTESDADFYKLTVDSPGTMNILLANLYEKYNLYLLDSKGSILYYSDDALTYQKFVSYNFTAAGEYYIMVDAIKDFSPTEKYHLRVDKATTNDFEDNYEPNNNFSEAYTIDLGKEYQSWISTSGDSDYYKIHADSVGFMSVELKSLPFYYNVSLYTPTGELLRFSNDSREESQILNFSVTSPGDYYVLIYSYYGAYSAANKYSLKVDVNNFSSIGAIETPTENESVSGKINISGWYLDKAEVTKVQILVDGVPVWGEGIYGDLRPDIAALHPEYNNNNSGFHFELNTNYFPSGPHTISVEVSNTLGHVVPLTSRKVIFSNIIPVTDIVLDKGMITFNRSGETSTIQAIVIPSFATNRNVSWKTNNSSVAVVDSKGTVTAVGPGSATVSAITEDGGLIANSLITVLNPVKGVSLNKTELKLKQGEQASLTATINPSDASEKTVEWKSSNNSVATVDSYGRILAVGRGTSTIMVTTKDGSYTASCVVSVIGKVGWSYENGSWYYYNADGAMRVGWLYTSNRWYYLNSNGKMAIGWVLDGTIWYFMDSYGAMVTGWQKLGNVWYYFKSSGAMATNWLNLGGTWYYLKPSGAMATGWLNLSGTWYYLKDSGAMATGWLTLGSTRYYLNPSGAMATGWVLYGGKWYYFLSSGAMAVNTTVNGYRFDRNGVWIP